MTALLALAAMVRAHMARTGETQEALAARIGWTQSGLANKLARIEGGQGVSWAAAEKLAAAIGYEVVVRKKEGREK